MNLRRTTERLIIRPLQASDYGAWYQTQSTMLPKQNPWDIAADTTKDLSRRQFDVLLQDQRSKRESGSHYSLGVLLKNKSLVGSISIMHVIRDPYQSAELGFHIFNRFWGQGYGSEAARAGVRTAFETLKLHRLEAKVPLRNTRSIKIIRGLGFREEGISKRRLNLNGIWIDLYVFALTSEDL
jgi:[ribosomal protein S5]-alanine N-acetyltransferase